MNPFDELSIEESVRIRERRTATPAASTTSWRSRAGHRKQSRHSAHRHGDGRGSASIHVEVEGWGRGDRAPGDCEVAEGRGGEGRRAIWWYLGKQSIDDDSGQTGQMLAGLVGVGTSYAGE